MNDEGKRHLIIAKKRLNSAQLELQRALSLEDDDDVLMGQMDFALEYILSTREIVDFVMTSYGMEVEDATN